MNLFKVKNFKLVQFMKSKSFEITWHWYVIIKYRYRHKREFLTICIIHNVLPNIFILRDWAFLIHHFKQALAAVAGVLLELTSNSWSWEKNFKTKKIREITQIYCESSILFKVWIILKELVHRYFDPGAQLIKVRAGVSHSNSIRCWGPFP